MNLVLPFPKHCFYKLATEGTEITEFKNHDYEKVKDKAQVSKVIPLQGKINLKKGISYTIKL